ncbi:hypothetical protein COU75_04115 [Candidatus Peregrinibacteria bacterium CG10_big_fil_rev_8_21_14_0_10_42_8]|nr:MAG: hypothetical protein COU75_04115 [Candidatus Peregrinibacteria bacterium CG10_big_fil_rev_8_21_14_0_10_42_8]
MDKNQNVFTELWSGLKKLFIGIFAILFSVIFIVVIVSLFSSSDSPETSTVVTNESEAYQGSLSLQEQQQFYYEHQEVLDVAECTSIKAFPNANASSRNYNPDDVMKMIDHEHELGEKYKAEVRADFGLTEDEAWQILIGGYKAGWAIPEFSLGDC